MSCRFIYIIIKLLKQHGWMLPHLAPKHTYLYLQSYGRHQLVFSELCILSMSCASCCSLSLLAVLAFALARL